MKLLQFSTADLKVIANAYILLSCCVVRQSAVTNLYVRIISTPHIDPDNEDRKSH
jgi:hypothetical protein